jgi:ubiquinone/menaquinone biosynthesis C-methylase UbiE
MMKVKRNIKAINTVPLYKKLLHVGCGAWDPLKLPEKFRDLQLWEEIRFDIDPNVKPNIIGDIRNMVDVKTETMDAIWSSHNIEHLYAHEVPLALKEFYRVLKKGGELLITLPDMQSVAEYIVADKLEDVLYISPAGPITPLEVLYGYGKSIKNGNLYMAHKTAFTAKTLENKLSQAGFTNIKIIRDQHFNLWGSAYKKGKC